MESELTILFISLVLFIVGIILWQKGNRLLLNGKKTIAVIFKNNMKHSGSDNDMNMYYPVVRFTTDTEEWITQELSVGYSPAKQEGTKLEVIYNPENPTEVAINSSFQLEILPRFLTAIGITGLIIALLEFLEVTQLIAN